ncbi:hypothetical protein GCM10023063_18430 [Arthrobacter methylotrophus]|uniref:non-specific serine/threonine protein kinase n=1 Tax=Arthrobacter methylotrophus TaxID=121291 RepID=A0ABV5URQ5_9MICC
MQEGQKLAGRYTLERRLGKGGMGEVWLARDGELNRPVAIKCLSEGAAPGPGYRRRLELEAETLADLDDARIVPIFDKFIEANQLYLVMKYIEGTDLGEAVKTGAISDASKVSILTDVLEALTYLHDEKGVVHRDLKPSNILLDRKGRAYVADFGIARSARDPEATKSIHVFGSLPFMAPEVRAGKHANSSSDIWSFGAVALWLFTGKVPDGNLPPGLFAGELTALIRDALGARRPVASELLEAFKAVKTKAGAGGLSSNTATVPVPVIQTGKRRRWILAAVGAVVLLLVTAIAAISLRPGGSAAPSSPPVAAPTIESPSATPTTATPTPTPTPSTSPSPSATPSPTPSDTSTAPAPVAGPSWVYLSDMQPIETQAGTGCTGGCAGFVARPVSIAGDVYPRSYQMGLLNDGTESTSQWNAYTKCTSLEATIGLDDSSASVTARFVLEREGGTSEELGVLTTGVAKKVKVDLTGVFRFKLVAYLTPKVTGNVYKVSAWGDVRMLCSALPTPGS